MRKNNNHRNEPFLRHLGDVFRNRRVDLYLSQEQLGLIAGFHRSYITDIENGQRNMSLLTAMKVSKALKSRLSLHIGSAEQALQLEHGKEL